MTLGQGQGVPTWRNILLSASSPNALAKLAVLEGGVEGSGEGDVVTRTTSCHCCVERVLSQVPLDAGVGEWVWGGGG